MNDSLSNANKKLYFMWHSLINSSSFIGELKYSISCFLITFSKQSFIFLRTFWWRGHCTHPPLKNLLYNIKSFKFQSFHAKHSSCHVIKNLIILPIYLLTLSAISIIEECASFTKIFWIPIQTIFLLINSSFNLSFTNERHRNVIVSSTVINCTLDKEMDHWQTIFETKIFFIIVIIITIQQFNTDLLPFYVSEHTLTKYRLWAKCVDELKKRISYRQVFAEIKFVNICIFLISDVDDLILVTLC